MSKSLTDLLIKSGVTWEPKKKAEFLKNNNVEVLPCDIGDKLYIHSSLLPKETINFQFDEIPTYLEGTVVFICKNKSGWFLDIAINTESIKINLHKVDSVEFGKTLFKDSVYLDTYPDENNQQCREFQIPTGWLLKLLEKMDELNENNGVNLENFLCNYCYDETHFIYMQAKIKGKLISEQIIN